LALFRPSLGQCANPFSRLLPCFPLALLVIYSFVGQGFAGSAIRTGAVAGFGGAGTIFMGSLPSVRGIFFVEDGTMFTGTFPAVLPFPRPVLTFLYLLIFPPPLLVHWKVVPQEGTLASQASAPLVSALGPS
jgi:hypothetical protein